MMLAMIPKISGIAARAPFVAASMTLVSCLKLVCGCNIIRLIGHQTEPHCTPVARAILTIFPELCC